RDGCPAGRTAGNGQVAHALRVALAADGVGRDGGDRVRCDHEHDDGAYVLGALSPAERAAYERHLATCSFCREAVADISTLPDLLARLDAKEFAKLLDPTLTADHPGASLRDMAAPAAAKGKRRKNFGVR